MYRDHPEMALRLPSGEVTASDAYRFDSHLARIARRLSAGVEFSAPVLSGLPYGQYAYGMTLYLGTPPQKFVVLVDTGSDLVWVQCQPCTSPHMCYNETDPFFNPSASSSYSAVPCGNNITCDPTQVRNLSSRTLNSIQVELRAVNLNIKLQKIHSNFHYSPKTHSDTF